MDLLTTRYSENLTGVLSCYDRIVGLKFPDDHTPPGKLGHQQPFDDTKPTATRCARQATSVTHVGVVAAKLFGNGAGGGGRPRNDALGAQDLQQRDQCRMRRVRRAQRAAQAVAARQVVVQ